MIVLLMALQATYAQKKSSVTIMDFVKIKNNHTEEALYYYDNNWKVLRDMAMEKGFIKSYQILTNTV